jgi:hypothetical protein
MKTPWPIHNKSLVTHLKQMGVGVGVLTFVLMIPLGLIAVNRSADIRNEAIFSGPITPSTGPTCQAKPECAFSTTAPCSPPPEGWCEQQDEDIYFDFDAMMAGGIFEIRDSQDQIVELDQLKRGRSYSYTIEYIILNKWKNITTATNEPNVGVRLFINSQQKAENSIPYNLLRNGFSEIDGAFAGTFVADKTNVFAVKVDSQSQISEVNEINNFGQFAPITGYRTSDSTYDGFVDLSDYSVLVSKFFTNDPDADATGDGFVDISDYSKMVSEFFFAD